jgi:hypothetical protein
MKQSVKTGSQIYMEMKTLYKDIEELAEACDVIADEVGVGSVAHKHLRQLYDEKKKEIAVLEKNEYTAIARPLAPPPPLFGLGEEF